MRPGPGGGVCEPVDIAASSKRSTCAYFAHNAIAQTLEKFRLGIPRKFLAKEPSY